MESSRERAVGTDKSNYDLAHFIHNDSVTMPWVGVSVKKQSGSSTHRSLKSNHKRDASPGVPLKNQLLQLSNEFAIPTNQAEQQINFPKRYKFSRNRNSYNHKVRNQSLDKMQQNKESNNKVYGGNN